MKINHHQSGKDLSYACKWNVRDITKVYIGALTNSNFHTFRKQIVKLYNKEFKKKLRLYG